jgi:DNA mismatch repair protein MutL
VNRRPVRNKTLTAALDEAYRSLTPEKRYPACVLLVDMNPRLVDVNVHPAKIEVKFQREGEVFEAVVQAIRAALLEHGMIPSAVGAAAMPTLHPRPAPPRQEGARAIPAPPLGDREGGRTPAFAPEGDAESPHQAVPATDEPTAGTTPPRYVPDVQTVHRLLLQRAGLAPREEQAEETAVQQSLPAMQAETEPLATTHLPFAHLLDDLQILGQVQNTFIIASTRKGLVIIDQHVAHERVLYEQFCEQRGGTPIPRQPLLNPEPLMLDRRSALLLAGAIGGAEPTGVRAGAVRAGHLSGACHPRRAGGAQPAGGVARHHRGAGRAIGQSAIACGTGADLDYHGLQAGGQGGRPAQLARDCRSFSRTLPARRTPISARMDAPSRSHSPGRS